MDNEIKDNLYDLYSLYRQHKQLYKFWKDNKSMRTKEEIQERIEYIKKHKVNQKTEIETLLWILNEVD